MKTSRLRKDAEAIFQAGLDAVRPIQEIKKHITFKDDRLSVKDQIYDLKDYEAIYVIGTGKASAAMAQAVEALLGERLKEGVVNVKYGHSFPVSRIKVNEAGHPVPDEAGFRGTQEIVQLLKETGKNDLVLFLISGGGSALLPYPAEGLTLEDKQEVTKCLLEVGARIHEINAKIRINGSSKTLKEILENTTINPEYLKLSGRDINKICTIAKSMIQGSVRFEDLPEDIFSRSEDRQEAELRKHYRPITAKELKQIIVDRYEGNIAEKLKEAREMEQSIANNYFIEKKGVMRGLERFESHVRDHVESEERGKERKRQRKKGEDGK